MPPHADNWKHPKVSSHDENYMDAREGSATTVDKLEGIRNAVREAVGNAVRDTVNRTRQS